MRCARHDKTGPLAAFRRRKLTNPMARGVLDGLDPQDLYAQITRRAMTSLDGDVKKAAAFPIS